MNIQLLKTVLYELNNKNLKYQVIPLAYAGVRIDVAGSEIGIADGDFPSLRIRRKTKNTAEIQKLIFKIEYLFTEQIIKKKA